MNKLMRFWNLLFLASATLFLVSCEDEGGTDDPSSPTITETHTYTGTQGAATTIEVTLKGVKGANALQSLKITEDGDVLPVSRFKFGGTAQASGTILLTGADANGFEKILTIDLPEESGTYKYTATLTDDKSKSDNVSWEVVVKGVTVTNSDTLWNYRGPFKGGLNLSTGAAVAKGNEFPGDPEKGWLTAHIRDNGNENPGDNTFPWKAEIIRWNETELRPISAATYDNAKNAADIQAAFTAAGSNVETFKLTQGGTFAAKSKEGEHFVVKVAKVQNDGSATKNEDYSLYEIKK